MMAILTQIIAQLATFLVTVGVPARQSTLYALILIYLLVSCFLAVLLLIVLVRRQQRTAKKALPPSDLES